MTLSPFRNTALLYGRCWRRCVPAARLAGPGGTPLYQGTLPPRNSKPQVTGHISRRPPRTGLGPDRLVRLDRTTGRGATSSLPGPRQHLLEAADANDPNARRGVRVAGAEHRLDPRGRGGRQPERQPRRRPNGSGEANLAGKRRAWGRGDARGRRGQGGRHGEVGSRIVDTQPTRGRAVQLGSGQAEADRPVDHGRHQTEPARIEARDVSAGGAPRVRRPGPPPHRPGPPAPRLPPRWNTHP